MRAQGRSDLVMNLSGAAGGALAGPVLALFGYAGLAYGVTGLSVLIVIGAFVVGRSRVPKVTTS